MDLVNFIAYALCTLGVLNACRGERIAVKGLWYDVKLHCRETGEIRKWSKYTKETPTVWFWTQKVWYC